MNNIDYLGQTILLDDKNIWDYLCKAKNLKGLFQFETESAARVLEKIQPINIEDLSLATACNRPGPIKMVEEIAKIRNGEKLPTYSNIALEPFLKDTYSFIIYQEQILKIAQILAGFSPKDSATLLKSLGKKDEQKMESLKNNFISGVLRNNHTELFAIELFNILKNFANYGFNKSHATSYSTMSYISAYIKFHHPLQFCCSLLNYAQYEQKPINEIAEIVSEFPDWNIKILPPSIHKMSNKFMIEDGNIRYPIGLLKGLAEASFDKLKTITSIQLTNLDSFLESILATGLNSRGIESIIISGAVDCFGAREDILFYYWFLSELSQSVLDKFWIFKNGNSMSRDLIFKFLEFREEIVGKLKQGELFTDAPVKNIRYKSHFKTEITRTKILEKVKDYDVLTKHYANNVAFARFLWETYTLGYSYHYNFNPNVKTFKDLNALKENHIGSSCGFVDEIQFRTSKKGNDYAKMRLKFDRKQDMMLFSEVCEMARGIVKENSLVKFSAIKMKDKLKIDNICVIDNIRTKFEFYNKVINEKVIDEK